MKIGELFVALGFDIKGQKEFDAVQSGMDKAFIQAGKLTIGVDLLNLGLLALLETATKMAVGFKNFALQTGLSTEELQRWQHIAAVNNVTAEELTSTVKSLQDTRAAFALGEPQAVGAWSLLGIDPTQDPFKVLEQLRARLRGFADTGIARNIAGKVGISDNVFQMLVASNEEFEKWNRQFEVTREQTDKLRRLDNAWRDLRFEISAVKAQFASALAPVLTAVTKALAFAGQAVAAFTNWLTSHNLAATVTRTILAVLAVVLVAVGIAVTTLTAALAGLLAIMALLSPALIAVATATAPVIATVAALAAAISGLILLFDDYWTAVHGGKSAFDWTASIAMVNAMAIALARVADTWEKLIQLRTNAITGVLGGLADLASGPARSHGAGGNWTQTNNVEVHVSGADSPETTGNMVAKTLRQEISDAAYQAPVPNR